MESMFQLLLNKYYYTVLYFYDMISDLAEAFVSDRRVSVLCGMG